jgi:glycosyltransferase involved in cell wall biosynthesis
MLPVKLLEFAMMGVPAISAKLKTVEHYFGNGAVCFFKPGDVNELAQAIERLYRSPELRKQHADLARKVVDHFSWPKQRAEFYRAIDSILPRREPASAPQADEPEASAASAR